MRAVTLLPELGFLPTDGFRLQSCLEALPALHPALQHRIPDLLLATARALAATGQASDDFPSRGSGVLSSCAKRDLEYLSVLRASVSVSAIFRIAISR